MLDQLLKNYSEDEIRIISEKFRFIKDVSSSLVIDKSDVVKISNNLTKLHNALNATQTYENNIFKLMSAQSSASARSSRENILENVNDVTPTSQIGAGLNSVDFSPLISSINILSEKISSLDLSPRTQGLDLDDLIPKRTGRKLRGSKIGGVLALGAGAVAISSMMRTRSPVVQDTVSEKNVKLANRAITTSEERAEATKISNDSFASKFSSFISEFVKSPIMSAIGAVGGFFGDMLGIAEEPPSPNESTKIAMDYFTSQGWTREQAAGIVGNLQVESGNFAPDVVTGKRRGDNGTAVGIAQWHPDRQAHFQQIFKRPLAGAALQQQLQFIQHELNGREKAAGNMLRSAKTAEEAASIVDRFYERSSGQHRAQRIANARALVNLEMENAKVTTISNNIPSSAENTTTLKDAAVGTIWRNKERGVTTFVRKIGPSKYETWTSEYSNQHYQIDQDQALAQIKSRNLTSSNRPSTTIVSRPPLSESGRRAAGSSSFTNPVPGARLSSEFSNARRNPVDGVVRPHTGIDLAAPAGTPVLAAKDGIVVDAGSDGTNGNFIKIDHRDGTMTSYAHLLSGSIKVSRGMNVRGGQTIAGVGSTGRSTGNHLHFTVYQNGRKVDPVPYISGSRQPSPAAIPQPQIQPKRSSVAPMSSQRVINQRASRRVSAVVTNPSPTIQRDHTPYLLGQNSQTNVKPRQNAGNEYIQYLLG